MSGDRQKLGWFKFDAKAAKAGPTAVAILYSGGEWDVVPSDDSDPPPLCGYFARYLNSLYGPRKWAEIPAGMGSKHHRLFHAAMQDLAGTEGELFEPPAAPPGRIH